ncbi:MAG: AAA family ATPase [Spirochaetaceae bacterium]|nr:MAG: AAA family ATPase [Spirochaetaceae bacterium]
MNAAALEKAIQTVIVGNTAEIRALVVAFISGLHVLVEDIPGVGKTTLARAFARATGLDFGRIQFTPDLLPGDITGMNIWSPDTREFSFRAGSVMHQFILADEINRASARTQSALLEAMQEGSVTVDGVTRQLPDPFFVMATQNPIQFTGTFLLPEGQLDRFGVGLHPGYPSVADEAAILSRFRHADPLESLEAVMNVDELRDARREVRSTRMDRRVEEYIARFASLTRTNESLRLGLSPRGSMHLMRAAQGYARLDTRDYVVPEDVQEALSFVVPHKIVLSEQARLRGLTPHEAVRTILDNLPVPSRLSD